jgi:hypothetical protein
MKYFKFAMEPKKTEVVQKIGDAGESSDRRRSKRCLRPEFETAVFQEPAPD